MKESELNQEIFSRYGAVTRARGPFLYTKKGVRLTDCFQAGGRAILGWGGGDAFTRFKNILNRGLTGSFITEYTSQIDKAVSELLAKNYAQVARSDDLNNSYRQTAAKQTYELRIKNEELGDKRKVDFKVYFFRDKKEALKAGLEISPENTSVWLPWRDAVGESECVIITPPLPWADSVCMLAVSCACAIETAADRSNDVRYKMPRNGQHARPDGCINPPPPLVAAITRSIYDLIAALKSRTEKDWFIYDQILTKYFTRKGPYLYPKIAETKYDDFVRFCLDAEIVISPEYNTPSIIPFGADKGVFTKLKNAMPPDCLFKGES